MSHILRPQRQLSAFEERVYEYTQHMGLEGSNDHWDINLTNTSLTLHSATPGPPARVTFTFTITPPLTNTLGNLHGGCSATLIDVLSTTILMAMSKPGRFALGGVSRHLDVTYLRPVPVGSPVRLVCEVVQMGRRLALLRAEIFREDDGLLCVVGVHEKANTDPEVGRV